MQIAILFYQFYPSNQCRYCAETIVLVVKLFPSTDSGSTLSFPTLHIIVTKFKQDGACDSGGLGKISQFLA